ncbi:MAG: PorV/PorQ family protein [candidate division Zixibacteria bacterium]|nr:PorV/PorQ family protein [candidate division Zixibacteria bacterium]
MTIDEVTMRHPVFDMVRRRMPTLDCSVASLALCGLLMTFVVSFSPATAYGQAKVGTTGAQFLELGVSARAMGMGEAFAATVDDISAVYYNPAALSYLLGKEAMATYISMPADIGYGFAAIGLPLESIGGVLGIGTYALSSGSMLESTYGRPKGTGREFSYNDFALSLGYGRYLTDRFSVGLTVRYIGEFTHDFAASGWSADVGTLYNTGYRGFKIAMVITNFGPDLKFISEDYPLPINFKFGGSINMLEMSDHVATFAAEGSHPSDNLEKYNAGVEYTYKDMFVLRGGSRFNYDVDGFTAGGGVRLPFGQESEIRIDYAFQDFDILTEVHRFSMSFGF